jgi:hypothetical protein
MPTLYVPWKKPSEIKPEDTLIGVGFTAVDVKAVSEGVRITKYDEQPARQNRKNEGFSILVSNRGTLLGRRSGMIYYAYKDANDPQWKEFSLLNQYGKYLGCGRLKELRFGYGGVTIHRGLPKDKTIPPDIETLLDEDGNLPPSYRVYWFEHLP